MPVNLNDLVPFLDAPGPSADEALDAPNLTVVVVDDEEPVRRFLDRALRQLGFAPQLAMSGPEGLRAAIRMQRLDVLVTDINMPGMDGQEMVKQLRAVHPEAKVLYISGVTGRLFAERALLGDGEAFLNKPCSITDLGQALSLLLCGSPFRLTPVRASEAPAADAVRSR